MKTQIVLFLIAASYLLGGSAPAQVDANRLCLHNGAEYYANAGWMPHTSVNDGAGKYFPSFIHWASTRSYEGFFDWKIRGYAWTGMQGKNDFGNEWYWGKFLQSSWDNPYASTMTFPYPLLYCNGTIPHSDPPWIVYTAVQEHLSSGPSSCPSAFYSKEWSFPSSYGGFDEYINVFEYVATDWYLPSTMPQYGYDFGIIYDAPTVICLPSYCSIYQYTFENMGPHGQYQMLSGNEMDCTQLMGGNKGKNYFIGHVGDTSWFYYNNNACTGGDTEWAMCLFLEDAVTFPVNYPGATNYANPYEPEGFDVGVATITPNSSSLWWSLQPLYEDYDSDGDVYFLLGSWRESGAGPPGVPDFLPDDYRLPGKWDDLSRFIFLFRPFFQNMIAADFTACMFGTTVGGLGPFPIPIQHDLSGIEIRWWGFNVDAYRPSAGFLTTFF